MEEEKQTEEHDSRHSDPEPPRTRRESAHRADSTCAVRRDACPYFGRRHVYARWRAAEEGTRSACGARSARRNDDDEANRHHHTPPRAPCSSVAARAASLRCTCVARVARASPVATRTGETRSARSGKEERHNDDSDRPEDLEYIDRPRYTLTLRESRRRAASPHTPRKLRAVSVLSCTLAFG